jgi:hypothetical protein
MLDVVEQDLERLGHGGVSVSQLRNVTLRCGVADVLWHHGV